MNLVNIEWSVTETTISDTYQINIEQVFQTKVPAPVVVIEPGGVNVPQLAPGEVFNGEFTVSNYGLIEVYDVGMTFPESYGDYEIKIFTELLPDKLAAMQSVRIPYRITRKAASAVQTADLYAEVCGYGGFADCVSGLAAELKCNSVICPNSDHERVGSKLVNFVMNFMKECLGIGGDGGGDDGASYSSGNRSGFGGDGPVEIYFIEIQSCGEEGEEEEEQTCDASNCTASDECDNAECANGTCNHTPIAGCTIVTPPDDGTTDDGTGGCTTDSDCESGITCIYGTCGSNGVCDYWGGDYDGCTDDGGCQSDADCSTTLPCIYGTCGGNGICEYWGGDGDGCVDDGGCQSDADCSSYTCLTGTCSAGACATVPITTGDCAETTCNSSNCVAGPCEVARCTGEGGCVKTPKDCSGLNDACHIGQCVDGGCVQKDLGFCCDDCTSDNPCIIATCAESGCEREEKDCGGLEDWCHDAYCDSADGQCKQTDKQHISFLDAYAVDKENNKTDSITVEKGQTVPFGAYISDSCQSVAYDWRASNGMQSFVEKPIFPFNDDDVVTLAARCAECPNAPAVSDSVQVEVLCEEGGCCTDNFGAAGECVGGQCKPVSMASVTAKANGKEDNVVVPLGASVTFSVDYDGENCTPEYKWTFSDGRTSTEKTVTSTELDELPYTGTVEVSCKCGNTKKSDSVTVEGPKCGPNIEGYLNYEFERYAKWASKTLFYLGDAMNGIDFLFTFAEIGFNIRETGLGMARPIVSINDTSCSTSVCPHTATVCNKCIDLKSDFIGNIIFGYTVERLIDTDNETLALYIGDLVEEMQSSKIDGLDDKGAIALGHLTAKSSLCNAFQSSTIDVRYCQLGPINEDLGGKCGVCNTSLTNNFWPFGSVNDYKGLLY